jgi:hypothetical protein
VADINPADLPELDLTKLDAEIRKEQKYGNKGAEAYLGQTLNTVTFGASDALAVAAGADPERLREVRALNPDEAAAGTATGIILPALATMGGSAAAQLLRLPAPQSPSAASLSAPLPEAWKRQA